MLWRVPLKAPSGDLEIETRTRSLPGPEPSVACQKPSIPFGGGEVWAEVILGKIVKERIAIPITEMVRRTRLLVFIFVLGRRKYSA